MPCYTILLLLASSLGAADAPPSETRGATAAIFHEPDLPRAGAPASPEAIARILQEAGIQTRQISTAELVDPAVFQASQFDLLVVPSGRTFPAEGRQALIEYLRGGGHLITLGGYAFDNQVRKVDGRWVDEAQRVQAELQRATSAERSLLRNGGFEETQELPLGDFKPDGLWRRTSPRDQVVDESPHEGRRCVRLTNPPETGQSGTLVLLELPAKPGTAYRISGWMRAKDISGPGMAYMAVYQPDAEGKLADFRDFAVAGKTTPWQRYEYRFVAAPRAARIQVKLGLYNTQGTAWFDDIRLADVTGIELQPINTSNGRPRDGLVVEPSQIGIFDPSFPLKRACRMRTAAGQHVVREPISLAQPLTGWAASGVIGYDNARWIPLVQAYDRFDRPRGPAGAMVLNYGGFYAGSWWAMFGVENVDLFADPNGPMARALGQVAQFLVRGVALHNLATDQHLYEPGEAVQCKVVVENRSRRAQSLSVGFTLGRPGSEPLANERREVRLEPQSRQTVEVALPKFDREGDLFEVAANVSSEGQVLDELKTGFVVRRPEMLRAAPELRFQDNYFTLDGRPTFLFGSDTYGCVYQSAAENPLTWCEETTAARDIGLNLYEILQPTVPGHKFQDRDWRSFHGLNQLVEKQGLVFMPGMLVGHNVAIGDERLAEQSQLCAEYARQFADSRALLYYINGDYVLRLDEHPKEVQSLWNRWLAENYQTTERLKAAWGAEAVGGELGSLPFPPPNSGRWDDVAAVDRLRFQTWLMRRWNEAHVAAVRQHDSRHPITSEYYQRPFDGIDLVLSIDGQDVSNIGYFDKPGADIDGLPLKICWNDLRARGKGVSLGEYGVKTHPAWTEANGGSDYHLVRTETEQKQLFLAVAHYGLGLGASKVQNWCLRDDQAWVFPWGLFYPGELIPKDVAYAHRNLSLFWRHFRPRDEAPPLTVCLANQLRLGNEQTLGTRVGYQTFADLLALHYRFNTIDDHHLDRLPAATRVLLYPSPMAMDDDAYRRLADWVRGGGTLIVTGDFSHDADRQRTRTNRLSELAGVEFVAANYPNVARAQGADVRAEFTLPGLSPQTLRPGVRVKPVGAEVLGQTADGQSVLVRYQVGQGTVYYLTDPVELSEAEEAAPIRRSIYAALLAAAQIGPLPIEPNEPWLHVMEQPTATGRVHVVYNTRQGNAAQDVVLPTKAGQLQFRARDRWPAMAAVTDEGRLVAIHSDATAAVDDKPLLSGSGLQGLLSLDGLDLRQSEAMLVAPFEPGRIELPGREGKLLALVGNFQNGRWTTLETVPLDNAGASLEIDADRSTCLILLCRLGSEGRWTEQLTEAMGHPERIGGY